MDTSICLEMYINGPVLGITPAKAILQWMSSIEKFTEYCRADPIWPTLLNHAVSAVIMLGLITIIKILFFPVQKT